MKWEASTSGSRSLRRSLSRNPGQGFGGAIRWCALLGSVLMSAVEFSAGFRLLEDDDCPTSGFSWRLMEGWPFIAGSPCFSVRSTGNPKDDSA